MADPRKTERPSNVNEALLDNAVRHKIGLKRLEGTIRNKAVSKLNEYDEDFRRKLREHLPDILGPQTVGTGPLPQLFEELDRINQQAWDEAGSILESELRDATHYESEYQKENLESTVPLDIKIDTPPDQQLNQMVDSDVIDIEDNTTQRDLDGWVDSAKDERSRRVKNEVRMGAAEDLEPQTVEQQVMGTKQANYEDGSMHWGRVFAAGIAETALTHYTSQVQNRVAMRNTSLIKGVQWVSTLDLKTTMICISRDGNVYAVGQGPRPPAHYKCRSIISMITRSWQEMGINAGEISPSTRASMDGQVPGSMTYDDWLRQQPRYRVEEALGPKRASLYLDGDLEVDKFTNRSGDLINLDELRTKETVAFRQARNNRPDADVLDQTRSMRQKKFGSDSGAVSSSSNLGTVDKAEQIKELEQKLQDFDRVGSKRTDYGSVTSDTDNEIRDWLNRVTNKKLETRPARIRRLNGNWVRGSNRKVSIEMKEAAKREFNLTSDIWNPAYKNPASDLVQQTQDDLRYLYRKAQDSIEDDTIVLYRGIGDSDLTPGEYTPRDLESWTDDLETARSMASSRGDAGPGSIIREEIEKKQVLAHNKMDEWQDGPYQDQGEHLVMWGGVDE